MPTKQTAWRPPIQKNPRMKSKYLKEGTERAAAELQEERTQIQKANEFYETLPEYVNLKHQNEVLKEIKSKLNKIYINAKVL